MTAFKNERGEGEINAEADLDAQHSIQWYDERDPELGDDFLRKINDCTTSIEESPQPYPIVHRQVRRSLVKRFPYEILYEIEKDEIIIYAIYQCARDPEVWKRRRDA